MKGGRKWGKKRRSAEKKLVVRVPADVHGLPRRTYISLLNEGREEREKKKTLRHPRGEGGRPRSGYVGGL